MNIVFGRVYPRERGGDQQGKPAPTLRTGLSPRTRGRRRRTDALGRFRGSIPANAGETGAGRRSQRDLRVYPRERGGDSPASPVSTPDWGLSPRTRGRLRVDGPERDGQGSIPANAGETLPRHLLRRSLRVYPRERGGDSLAPPLPPRCAGLSPRTRGRPNGTSPSWPTIGSIPANAGETPPSRPRRGCPTVYPRERGGDLTTCVAL